MRHCMLSPKAVLIDRHNIHQYAIHNLISIEIGLTVPEYRSTVWLLWPKCSTKGVSLGACAVSEHVMMITVIVRIPY